MARQYEGHGDPGSTKANTSKASGGDASGSYTGVVLIHGLGDIKRNATLQQITNAVTYWLNHVADLTLAPEGTGRVWLTSDLTDDPNPDARASRATIELEAPAGVAFGGEDPSLRLEVREVWWAEAFGLPKVAAAIRWARIQFREEAAHLLLPIGKQAGPARAAARRPAREIPQALTYRPDTTDDSGAAGKVGMAGVVLPIDSDAHARLNGIQRALTHGALRIYAVLQYIWKVAQWLLLTPLITLLLLVMGLAKVLMVIPFFRTAVISAFTKLTDYVMLHWISSMQVYLLDYTRSAGMRQRFERELNDFLVDPHCDRIVVIAHSMGTVISYEGLTTVLGRPEGQASTKPITYICLAQALRRIWLLETADPHRVRGALPARVRWLHFWARYDPVTAGPLEPRSLPRPRRWAEGWTLEDYTALRTCLERCENVDVVNTDGTFTDHNAYWNNLEQVVGPVVRELVAGHPALERVVEANQANPDDILMRRWSVAWRATVSLLGGLAAGAGIILWDHYGQGGVGRWVGNLLLNIPWHDFANALCGSTCANLVPAHPQPVHLDQLYHALLNGGIVVPLLLAYVGAVPIVTLLTALAVTGAVMVILARLVAKPTPFAFRATELLTSQSRRYVFVLAAAALVLVTIASFIDSIFFRTTYVHTTSQLNADRLAYVWALGLAQVTGTVAFAAAVFQAAHRREWGWVVALPLSWLVLVSNHFDFGVALLIIAVAGCILTTVGSAQDRQWGWVTGILVVLLMLIYTTLGHLLFEYFAGQYPADSPLVASDVVYVEPYTPILLYGLWAGPLQLVPRGRLTNILRGALVVALVALALDEIYSLLGLPAVDTRLGILSRPVDLIASLTVTAGAVGAVAWGLSVLDAAQGRRWAWLVVLATTAATGAAFAIANSANVRPIAVLLVLFVATLVYALWSGAIQARRVKAT
jgi:hypothetical protein